MLNINDKMQEYLYDTKKSREESEINEIKFTQAMVNLLLLTLLIIINQCFTVAGKVL